MKRSTAKILCVLVILGATLQTARTQDATRRSEDDAEGNTYSTGAARDDNPTPDETSPPDPVSVNPSTGPIRSYLSSGIHFSQGIDSNPGDFFTSSSPIAPVTDIYGSANLLWVGRNSQTALDYLAGTTFYEGARQPGAYDKQRTQVLDFEQRLSWRKTQLTLRDSLRSLHEGGFGSTPLTATGAYISRFAQSAATEPLAPADSDFLGTQQPGQPDQQSSLINLVSMNLTRFLTRRSSLFMTGGYSFTNYFGSRQGLLDDHQFSALAGYNYQLNRKEQVGFVYGYQSLRFPQVGVGSIVTNSVELLYTRRVSDHMSFSAGGGPEFAAVHNESGGSLQRLNADVQAEISYRLKKASLNLSYGRLVTAGNGVFAGANSNIVRFSVERRMFRSWQASFNGGYSTVSRLTHSMAIPNGTQGDSYRYMFVGSAVQRPVGQRLDFFASYEFDNQNIGNLICGSSTACRPGLQQRHVAAVGFDWKMRPMRLH